jgi:hypothetical protein
MTRLKSADDTYRRGQLLQCALFHLEIRFDVTMSGLDTLVAQPQSDDGDVNAGLQQMHGRRVTNHMGAYSLAGQIRANGRGSAYRLLQQVVERIRG